MTCKLKYSGFGKMFVIRHNISADQSPVTVVNRTNVTLYGVQPGETYTVEVLPDHPLYTCNLSYAVLTIGNSHHTNYSLFNYRLSSHKRVWFTDIRDEFNQANWKLVITYTTHCITTILLLLYINSLLHYCYTSSSMDDCCDGSTVGIVDCVYHMSTGLHICD